MYTFSIPSLPMYVSIHACIEYRVCQKSNTFHIVRDGSMLPMDIVNFTNIFPAGNADHH